MIYQNLEGEKMNDIKEIAEKMTVMEINEAIAEMKEMIKVKKVAEMAEKTEIFKAEVKVGDTIDFIFKGEITRGKVDKINEKTFTIDFGDFKRAIRFDKYIIEDVVEKMTA